MLRVAGLRDAINRKRIGGCLVTNIRNVRYLSGFAGSSAFILVTKTRNIFVTDFRYKEEAERELKGWDVLIARNGTAGTIKRLAARLGLRSLAFESEVPYDFFKSLSGCCAGLMPLKGVVEGLRAIKDRDEIKLIKEAVRRAEGAFLDTRPYIKEGRRERDIALLLEERLRKRGCNSVPFDIIVASGVNSAMPHARAGWKKLAKGDLVVIDWGGEAEGYCADITRTLLVKGSKPDMRGFDYEKKREIYETVLKANRKATASVAHGVGCRAVDKAARDIIIDAGYGKFFGHGTGHGVGLDIHEAPRISRTGRDAVKENMVFTIEPGIYIEGLGGVRIEDMVLAKPDGPEVLTKLSRKLELV